MLYAAHKEALVQGKAYRALRAQVSAALASFNVGMSEWTLMGLLYDSSQQRISDLAEQLEVELPQVTVLLQQLLKKGYVSMNPDPRDNRAKQATLTERAMNLMPQIEAAVHGGITKIFTNVTDEDIAAYFKVLNAIIGQDSTDMLAKK